MAHDLFRLSLSPVIGANAERGAAERVDITRPN